MEANLKQAGEATFLPSAPSPLRLCPPLGAPAPLNRRRGCRRLPVPVGAPPGPELSPLPCALPLALAVSANDEQEKLRLGGTTRASHLRSSLLYEAELNSQRGASDPQKM